MQFQCYLPNFGALLCLIHGLMGYSFYIKGEDHRIANKFFKWGWLGVKIPEALVPRCSPRIASNIVAKPLQFLLSSNVLDQIGHNGWSSLHLCTRVAPPSTCLSTRALVHRIHTKVITSVAANDFTMASVSFLFVTCLSSSVTSYCSSFSPFEIYHN